nr:FHA domain-containing protein [uncultured Roseateles sp.]
MDAEEQPGQAMTTDHIGVLELLGREGQVLRAQRVLQWPVRIGRSPACELVLDDAHLAAEHAQLDWAEAGPQLRMLPSLNGGWQGERRLHAGDAIDLGPSSQFQLGASQLRWRGLDAALPPEQPLETHLHRLQGQHLHLRPGLAPVLGLLLLWLAMLAGQQWAQLNPGSRWMDYSGAVLLPLAGLLSWVGFCALVTQLFRRSFPFAAHLRIALRLLILRMLLLGLVLPALAYALSWPRLMVLDDLVDAFGLALLLGWHASLIWPRPRVQRRIAVVLVSLACLGLGLDMARRQEQQYWLGPAYLSALPPPALRLVEPKPVAELLDALRPLEAELARQAAKDNDQVGASVELED